MVTMKFPILMAHDKQPDLQLNSNGINAGLLFVFGRQGFREGRAPGCR